MLRLQFTQAPPSVVARGQQFYVGLRVVNETGNAPHLPGTVALTARLLESHNRHPIAGVSLLEVVACGGKKGGGGKEKGGDRGGGGNGKASNKGGGKQPKLYLEPSGEGQFHARILPTCNGLHYSGNTHTEACYHLITRPVLIEFTAQYIASAASAASQPATKKGSKPEKGRATSGGHGSGNGRAAAGLSVLAATSLPMEVVPASQKAELKRRATNEAAAATAEAAHPASLHSSASSRVIEFCGHQLVIEEWPSNTAACTGAIVWDNALLLCRYLRETLGKSYFTRKRVVDVGCGTGLVGICTALLGAHAILTDLEEGAVLADRNVVANAAAMRRAGGSAEVVRHCWGEDVSQVLRGGAVDMVIACEVVYNNDAFSSLIHTLCQLIGPKTRGILALRKRHGCDIELFLEMLARHFTVTSTALHDSANGIETVDMSVSRVKHLPQLYQLSPLLP